MVLNVPSSLQSFNLVVFDLLLVSLPFLHVVRQYLLGQAFQATLCIHEIGHSLHGQPQALFPIYISTGTEGAFPAHPTSQLLGLDGTHVV